MGACIALIAMFICRNAWLCNFIYTDNVTLLAKRLLALAKYKTNLVRSRTCVSMRYTGAGYSGASVAKVPCIGIRIGAVFSSEIVGIRVFCSIAAGKIGIAGQMIFNL